MRFTPPDFERRDIDGHDVRLTKIGRSQWAPGFYNERSRYSLSVDDVGRGYIILPNGFSRPWALLDPEGGVVERRRCWGDDASREARWLLATSALAWIEKGRLPTKEQVQARYRDAAAAAAVERQEAQAQRRQWINEGRDMIDYLDDLRHGDAAVDPERIKGVIAALVEHFPSDIESHLEARERRRG